MRMYGIELRINELEHWFLKRIMARLVAQGRCHDIRIEYLYEMIYNACRKEFSEDNKPTLDAYLDERYEASKNADTSISSLGKS